MQYLCDLQKSLLHHPFWYPWNKKNKTKVLTCTTNVQKNNNLGSKQNLYSSNAFQSRKFLNNKKIQRCEAHLLRLFICLVCGCSAIHFTLCLSFILLRFLCGTGKHTSNASFLCIFFGRWRRLTTRWSCFGPRALKHFIGFTFTVIIIIEKCIHTRHQCLDCDKKIMKRVKRIQTFSSSLAVFARGLWTSVDGWAFSYLMALYLSNTGILYISKNNWNICYEPGKHTYVQQQSINNFFLLEWYHIT